ncbi:hypothetical protein [Serratia nevei]|uniref:hypothetical protein n=1 Tax=Serratia nevei TaxID=2703794 RepID=UPI003FA7690B
MTLTIEELKYGAEVGDLGIEAVRAVCAEALANREAQPVAYTEQCEISNMQATGLYLRGFPDNSQGRNIPLYTAPPALAVPDEMPRQYQNGWPLDYSEYASGWNACRAAMLAAVPEGGNDHDTRR